MNIYLKKCFAEIVAESTSSSNTMLMMLLSSKIYLYFLAIKLKIVYTTKKLNDIIDSNFNNIRLNTIATLSDDLYKYTTVIVWIIN